MTVEAWVNAQASPCGIYGWNVLLRQVFIQVLQFTSVAIIPPVLYTHPFIYHYCNIILANDSVIKRPTLKKRQNFTVCIATSSGQKIICAWFMWLLQLPLSLSDHYHTVVLAGCVCCLVQTVFTLFLLLPYWWHHRTCLIFLKLQCCTATSGAMGVFIYAVRDSVPKVRFVSRWEGNIKIGLKEMRWESINWINMAQDRDMWWLCVNTVMIMMVTQNVDSFFNSISSNIVG